MQSPSFWPELVPHLRWLGYGGLVPFAAFGLGAWLLSTETLRHLSLLMLRVYGLSIVRDLDQDERKSLLYWSVVPSLLACTSFLLPSSGGCLTLAVIAALALAVDLRTAVRLSLPPDWRMLRLHLSIGAILALGAGAYLAQMTGK
ncbi:MAG: DUF3429 family protein [Betaproteobacteria bacterium]|nr:DUF3429 family protein [Betaproteobacteria bacterium]